MKIPKPNRNVAGWQSALLLSCSATSLLAQQPEERWSFNGDLSNTGELSSFEARIEFPNPDAETTATAGGGAVDLTTNSGEIRMWGGNRADAGYVDLGLNLVGQTLEARTIEIWATHREARAWSRIFSFGSGLETTNGAASDFLMWTWTRGTDINANRLEHHEGGGISTPDAANPFGGPFIVDTEFHIVVVVEPGKGADGQTRYSWYSENSANDDLVTTTANDGTMESRLTLEQLNDALAWLGRSQFNDQTANASYNEVRIFNRAVSLPELESYHDLGPDSIEHVDADDDGLPAWWEEANGLDDTDDSGVNGPGGNPDGDDSNNLEEFEAGSDPQDEVSTADDTDGDGLDDQWELTNLFDLNSDGSDDNDRDYNDNEMEESNQTDPLDGGSFADTEDDGLNDGWELNYFGDLDEEGTDDSDSDFFTNLQEQEFHTDPSDGSWSPAKSPLMHRWSFNGDYEDSVGSSDATIQDPDADPSTGGNVNLTTRAGEVTIEGGAKGTSKYVLLGNNLIGGSDHAVTVELWATQISTKGWAHMFEFGSNTDNYLSSTWTRGTDLNTARVEFKEGGVAALIDLNQTTPIYPLEQEEHVLVSLERFAGGGPLRESLLSSYNAASSADADLGNADGTVTTSQTLRDLSDNVAHLGRSQFPDETANASYNEVRVYKGAPPVVVREILHEQGPDAAEIVDVDGDDLPDVWETANGLSASDDGSTDAANEGALGDLDSDGFSNIVEMVANTAPNDAAFTPDDIDGDGLNDQWEQDNFGNLDQTGEDDPDLDFDTNLVEFNAGTDPNDFNSFTDTDNDDLPDSWEINFYGNIGFDDLYDNDEGVGDGLDNFDEFFLGTNPTLIDTDGDGLNDGDEADEFETDPLLADTDGDGLSDFDELNNGENPTDPLLADTDLDGQNDFFELANGSDPNDADSMAAVEYYWNADTLANGSVTEWVDVNEGVVAIVPDSAANNPQKDASGVIFDGDDYLRVTAENNPILGMRQWSASVVFRANGSADEGGATSTGDFPDAWWRNAALVGSEQPGGVGDWALGLGGDNLASIGTNDTTELEYADGGALNDNEIHVLTGVWDADTTTQRFYVDGVLVNETTDHAFNEPPVTGPVNFGVNIPTGGDAAFYTGRISDVVLNTEALPEADVLALHEQFLTVVPMGSFVISDIAVDGTNVTLTGSNLETGTTYHVASATATELAAGNFTPVAGSEFTADSTTETVPVIASGGAEKLFLRLVEGEIPPQ